MKAELRERYKEAAQEFFRSHNAAQLELIHKSLAEKLAAHIRATGKIFRSVAIYEPLRYELPVREIVAGVHELHGAEMLLPHWDSEKMWFEKRPDLVIVPGLFADREGNRLGRGKGYYDRYLAASDAHHVFLGYTFQLIGHVPTDPHDQRVDTVIVG